MKLETGESNFSTMYMRDEIGRCETLEELKDNILPLLKAHREQWVLKINEIITQNNYTKTAFAELCDVSRVTVDKWCKGSLPKNRETFLRIGLVAHYNIDEMNLLLQRYGRYSGLYSKNLEDCVCIYVLKNHQKDALEKYVDILNEIKGTISKDHSKDSENLTTEKFDVKLSEVQNRDELETFITENIAMFSFTYHKFYAYVKMCIADNYKDWGSKVYKMAAGQGWSSSLRQCVSAIRQKKWLPIRNKIISLGLYLSMDHDEVDEMLRLAHMEPLCAKNIFESVIMFILDNASLQNMLEKNSDESDTEDLYQYAESVLKELEFPEFAEFISELSEKDDAW